MTVQHEKTYTYCDVCGSIFNENKTVLGFDDLLFYKWVRRHEKKCNPPHIEQLTFKDMCENKQCGESQQDDNR